MILGSMPLGAGRFTDVITDDSIQPASIDLHIGSHFLVPNPGSAHVLMEPLAYEEREIENGVFVLGPHEFCLAVTLEKISLSEKFCGFVDGRSSTGRQGLSIQNAGFCDPGFVGTITLELFNALNVPVAIKPGTRVAQLVVCDVRGCDTPYNGRYQGQIKTTGAR